MLYLIKSAAFEVDSQGNDKFFYLLKIGFCEDDKKSSRLSTYRTENPTMKVLHLIPNGTVQHENYLHYKYRDKRYPKGREWYYYSDEIIKEFKSLSIKSIETEMKSFINSNKKARIKPILYNQLGQLKDLYSLEESIDDLLIISKNSKGIYKFNQVLKKKSIEYSDYAKKLLDKSEALFKYIEEIPSQWERLQYICGLEETKRNYVLDQLQEVDPVKEVFLAAGPERCKANGYSISKIKNELGLSIFNMDELDSKIYSEFHEGDCWLKANIKDSLQKIFDDCSYQRKAKSTTIEDWFETSGAYMNINGKRINGIKLKSRKKV